MESTKQLKRNSTVLTVSLLCKGGILLGGLGFLLFVLGGSFPKSVEAFYSAGLYLYCVSVLSWMTGLIPFSLTDLSLWAIPVLLVSAFCKGYRTIRKSKVFSSRALLCGLIYLLSIAGLIYFIFILFWGLNYARPSVFAILGSPEEGDLAARNGILTKVASMTNELRKNISPAGDCFDIKDDLHSLDLVVVLLQEELFSKLGYRYIKGGPVKKRLFSGLCLKLGSSGIYGPFTGETNIALPLAPGTTPFIIAHERAHLNGFASEMDANLIALLTLWTSSDPKMKYSAWLAFWSYIPSVERESLPFDSSVKKDLACIREFWLKHEISAATTVARIYGLYLRAQGQAGGISTYGQAAETIVRTFMKNGVSGAEPAYGLVSPLRKAETRPDPTPP